MPPPPLPPLPQMTVTSPQLLLPTKDDLFRALNAGDMLGIRRALMFGVDANSVDAEGRPALQVAIRLKNQEVVNLLISNGALLDGRDRRGNTVLHELARYSCDDAMANNLILAVWDKHGPTALWVRNDHNDTPTDVARQCGNHKLQHALLTQMLSDALCYEGDDLLIHVLQAGADPNSVVDPATGKTALHVAVERFPRNPDLLYTLLASGAAVNRKEHTYGFTPVHLALVTDQPQAAALLLSRGAEADKAALAFTREGNSLLHLIAAQ
jgi:ankyrin repeat protein